MYECIEEVIWKFVDEPSEFNEKNDRMEWLLGLLHTHWVNIYHQMWELHTYYENTKNIEWAKATSNAINMFINNMILIFQRFPESEKYIIGWAKWIAPWKMEYDIAMIHNTPDLVQ